MTPGTRRNGRHPAEEIPEQYARGKVPAAADDEPQQRPNRCHRAGAVEDEHRKAGGDQEAAHAHRRRKGRPAPTAAQRGADAPIDEEASQNGGERKRQRFVPPSHQAKQKHLVRESTKTERERQPLYAGRYSGSPAFARDALGRSDRRSLGAPRPQSEDEDSGDDIE